MAPKAIKSPEAVKAEIKRKTLLKFNSEKKMKRIVGEGVTKVFYLLSKFANFDILLGS